MIAYINNENFGYCVASYSTHAAIGNPSSFRWGESNTASYQVEGNSPAISIVGSVLINGTPITGSSTFQTNNPSQSFYAFDGLKGEFALAPFVLRAWYEPNPTATSYIGFEFTSSVVIQQYRIYSLIDYANAVTVYPISWVFEASNDGITYDILDTQTGFSNPYEYLSIPLENTSSYTHYRIRDLQSLSMTTTASVESGYQYYFGLSELELYSSSSAIPIKDYYPKTGSVDLFEYNKATDQHDFLFSLKRPYSSILEILLAAETGSDLSYRDPLLTESSSFYDWYTASYIDKNLKLDSRPYIRVYEDDYGHSVDLHKNLLAIGSRWYRFDYIDTSISESFSGSVVDIYNWNKINYNPYVSPPTLTTDAGFLIATILPPANDTTTASFGNTVSINDEWLAVGSNLSGSSRGAVHLYRRDNIDSGSNWTYFVTLSGSNTISGDQFGHSIELNKASGSYSGSLIIGTARPSSSNVYVYRHHNISGNDVWLEEQILEADRTIKPLTFVNHYPIIADTSYTSDRYGYSVAIWKDTLAVGAPEDRKIFEFVGSRLYEQGAVYIYEKCKERNVSGSNQSSSYFDLVYKTNGNRDILKNNLLGWSVDIWENNIVATSPKINSEYLSSCYIKDSLFQKHYCSSDLENALVGQWMFLQKPTGSVNNDWDITNIYQLKKKYLNPYRFYGHDCSICEQFIVIGSPMKMYDDNRIFDITYLYQNESGSVISKSLDDLTGKAYFYNLRNFRPEFYVGNVFYRNGKLVINTSGSVFEGLTFSDTSPDTYEYEIKYENKQTIHEKQIICRVEPGEFNFSTNPTAIEQEFPLLDINKNKRFDFQDLDILLRYMMFKNTYFTQTPNTNWSESIVKTDDEKSFFEFLSKDISGTDNLYSSSYSYIDTNLLDDLDFNKDNKVDINDMNILWKYYSNRLTQTNYQNYITPNSDKPLFSDIVDHMDSLTLKKQKPYINSHFLEYDSLSKTDKTGSFMAPFVTTIGLYSGLDLVGVAKLGTPIKIVPDFPYNFVVKMDF
jgi:hypothetical protein